MKYSLARLVSRNLVCARNSFRDRRRKIYFLRKKRTLGIVGGLSPEITAEFYLKLIEKSRKYGNSYPHIVIDSVPIEFSIEDEMIIQAKNQERLLPFLIGSIKRLQNTNLIVIPCNTAHVFIEDLRKESGVPIISIVETSIDRIKRLGYKKIGLLATSTTIKSQIFNDKEIEFLHPAKGDQKELSRIIVKIIRNEMTEIDKARLHRIADKLRKECDIILLACTDLQHVLKGNYLDSFDILVESVFEKIMIKKQGYNK